jgi:DNA replicative helicase MCM subunit Mcm2 (Cdc46/Mcm family)
MLVNSGPEEHTALVISALDLIHYDSTIGYLTLAYPVLLLPIFEDAIYETQMLIIRQHPRIEPRRQVGNLSVKPHCHCRIIELPPTPDLTKSSIGNLRSSEVDKLVQVTGTVVRAGSVRMLKVSKEYECMNPRCSFKFRVHADPELGHALPQPRVCPSSSQQTSATRDPTESQGGEGSQNDTLRSTVKKKCMGTNLREVEGSAVCVDYQEIKIQDQVTNRRRGRG